MRPRKRRAADPTAEEVQQAVRRFRAKGGLIRKQSPLPDPPRLMVGWQYSTYETVFTVEGES